MSEQLNTPRKIKKKFLKKYLKTKESVDRLEVKLLDVDTEIIRLSNAPKCDHVNMELDNLKADKTQLLDRINKLNRKAMTQRKQIAEKIDTLDNPVESQILEMVFIDGLDMCDIADDLSYSVRHVYRLYIEGLNHISLNKSMG